MYQISVVKNIFPEFERQSSPTPLKGHLSVELVVFKQKLEEEIRTGCVILDPVVMSKRYGDILSSTALKAKVNEIVNREVLLQEIAKRSTSSAEIRTEVERIVTKVFGVFVKREDIAHAEIECLKNLLKKSHPQDLAPFKEKIQTELLKERLQVQGIVGDKNVYLVKMIERLIIAQEKLLKKLTEVELATFTHLLPIILDLCKKKVSESALDYSKTALEERIQQCDFCQAVEAKDPSFLEMWENQMEEIVETFLKKISEEYMGLTSFFKRWNKHIACEYVQNICEDEALGGLGLCVAISFRWALCEQSRPDLKPHQIIEESMDLPQDRFKQALYFVSHSIQIKGRTHYTDEEQVLYKKLHQVDLFGIKEYFGIREIQRLGFTRRFETLEKYIKNFNHSLGIVVLMMRKHQISLRFDSEEKVYRIGDPNFGIFEFECPETFFECLKELLTRLYPNYCGYRLFQVQ